MRRRHISGPAQQAVVAVGRAFFSLLVCFNLVTGSMNPSENIQRVFKMSIILKN
jgi:hypothetical protein